MRGAARDGRFLVVAKAYDEFQHDRGSGALYLMPAEGGDAKLLLTPPAGNWFKNPALSPSGDLLAFISCWGTISAQTCDIFTVSVTSDLLSHGEPQQITHIDFDGLS
jgi:Tol biopolymer transport system component